jgi:hypothetical protein
MRCRENDFMFLEGMPDGSVPATRLASGKGRSGWKPYKLWAGDLYECPDCHAQTIVGVAMRPIAEHYQPEFGTAVEHYGAKLLVKDC